jgi:hypothetical protein
MSRRRDKGDSNFHDVVKIYRGPTARNHPKTAFNVDATKTLSKSIFLIIPKIWGWSLNLVGGSAKLSPKYLL